MRWRAPAPPMAAPYLVRFRHLRRDVASSSLGAFAVTLCTLYLGMLRIEKMAPSSQLTEVDYTSQLTVD